MTEYVNLNDMFCESVVRTGNILSKALHDNSEKIVNMSLNDERILNLEMKWSSLLYNGSTLLNPVVLDIEMTESQLLIGIYFPGLDSYFSMLFMSNTPEEVERFLRLELSEFFTECKYGSTFNKTENCLKLSKNLFNCEIRDHLMKLDSSEILIHPLILTYNGEDFDLGLITLFLWGAKPPYGGSGLPYGGISAEYNIPLSSRLKTIFDFGQLLINESRSLANYQRCKVYPFTSKEMRDNISRLDLMKFLKNESNSNSGDPLQFSGSLTKQKIKIFINNGVNGISLPIPLEFTDPPRLNGDYRSPVEYNYLESWITYNYNDVFYTFLLFVNNKLYKNHLELKDAQLGVIYLTSKVKIPFLSVENKLGINDLCFVEEFPNAMKIYKDKFSNLDYISGKFKDESKGNFLYKFKNLNLKFSLGGLHSSTEDNTMHCFASNDSIVYYDYDVRSFYSEIILKLFKGNNYKEVAEVYDQLSQKRIALKKAKDPKQLIYKIITLSITGQLNQKTSQVYNPCLYFTMTATGQLFLTETLIQSESLIEEVVHVNTDGFCVGISKSNLSKFNEKMDELESHYGYEFDTRCGLARGILFNVNKYVILTLNNEFKEKGFNDDSFGVLLEFLKSFLLSGMHILTIENVLNHIPVFFKKFHVLENLIKYIGIVRYKGPRANFYFSKKPESFSGMPLHKIIIKREYPVRCLNFEKNNENASDFVKNVFNDINLVAYTKLILNDLSKAGAFTIKDLQNFTNELWLKAMPLDFLLLNSATIRKAYELSQNVGVYCLPKQSNKRSLKSWTDNIILTKTLTPLEFFENSLQKQFWFWLNCTTVAIHVQESFPLICLDFDNVEIFFHKDFNNLELLKFLNILKLNHCLVLSSPVDRAMNRFKVCFKTQGFEDRSKFSKEITPFLEKFQISFEKKASLYGNHIDRIDLQGDINSQKWPSISYENLIKIFENQPDWKFDEVEIQGDQTNLTKFEFLTQIFKYELYLNHQQINQDFHKKGEVNSKTGSFHTIPNNENINLELQIKFCESMGLNSIERDILIPKSNEHNEISVAKENSTKQIVKGKAKLSLIYQGDKLNKNDTQMAPMVRENFQLAENILRNPSPEDSSFLKHEILHDRFVLNKNIENFDSSKLSSTENPLLLMEASEVEILAKVGRYLNDRWNFYFPTEIQEIQEKFDEGEKLVIRSPCIMKDGPDPEKSTVLILDKGEAYIYCHHERCRHYNIYEGISTEVSSLVRIIRINQDKDNCENFDGTIYNYFGNYF
jgi:hypothetical protein